MRLDTAITFSTVCSHWSLLIAHRNTIQYVDEGKTTIEKYKQYNLQKRI